MWAQLHVRGRLDERSTTLSKGYGTTELFARFEIGRRPKSIGVENGVVTPWEPREVTYAPKLHVPDPLFPPITTALGSQTQIPFACKCELQCLNLTIML